MRDSTLITMLRGLVEDEGTARRTHQVQVSLSLKAMQNMIVNPPRRRLGIIPLWRRRPTEAEFEKEYNRLKEIFLVNEMQAIKNAEDLKRQKKEEHAEHQNKDH